MCSPLAKACLAVLCLVPALDARDLSCFLADNHAETFGWITRAVDLDRPHTLVLVDAHSDASVAERSEEIRQAMRRVASEEERAARVHQWRRSGRLQAYNWIEPLMPRPIERMIWLPAPSLEKGKRAELLATAAAQLDGRLEVEPRAAGSFVERITVVDLASIPAQLKGPVILTIDLDFFAGMNLKAREATFERIWTQAMTWPGLEGVAFAVSRPWLRDDAEADELIHLALGAVSRTRGARLELKGRKDQHPDHSLQAAALRDAGKPVPRWSREDTSLALRHRLALLHAATPMPGLPRLTPDAGEVDSDGVWRYPLAEAPVLRASAPPSATGRVRWYALEPAHSAVDLWQDTGLGKGFAANPAARVYEMRRALGLSEDFALPPHRWVPEAGGRVRVEAEVETPQGWLPTAPIEIRLATVTGFRGVLSECFGMPYVFGIARVREGDLDGVETGWGSDCSNLLIHAWRRQGHGLVWGDPLDLCQQLELLQAGLRPTDRVEITSAQIEAGLVVNFGRHVAAVWEDRDPMGVLDGGDRVLHHLGGLPEILPLADLAKGRPRFSLFKPRAMESFRLRVAGDVVLAGENLEAIDGFEKAGADSLLVNLEGVPSMAPAVSGLRHDFRFPPERLDRLVTAQVDVVSLANNHAGDAGPQGLLEGLEELEKRQMAVVGAGSDQEAACAAWKFKQGEVNAAIFGVCLVDALVAGPSSPGVAKLPEHRDLLAAEFAKARQAGERIVVMVHGGREYAATVGEPQRRWARWLAQQGASVVGAHPHVIQRSEIHGGCRIHHSIGNAVYPANLKGLDSGVILDLKLDTPYFGSTQMLRK